ncbi:MAG: hypothetical protein JSR15_12285 [Proteobacteria bacterium]|nr:hypothetical protein [Pseudomonadota bacterium]
MPTATPAPQGQPAVWQPYDILVHLTRLPRPYSCDELWYKFRGVLVSLGAGRIDEVLPSECTSTSPDVHVQFLLPRLVHGAAAGDSAIEAAPGIVALEPGHPSHLVASDCQLVREISQSLLTDLPLKVQEAQFSCRSDHTATSSPVSTNGAREHYTLRVQALLPQWPERSPTPDPR